eukprot:scaffold1973_cov399-Prasinococcus_capsulatus_cf.AAC.29
MSNVRVVERVRSKFPADETAAQSFTTIGVTLHFPSSREAVAATGLGAREPVVSCSVNQGSARRPCATLGRGDSCTSIAARGSWACVTPMRGFG